MGIAATVGAIHHCRPGSLPRQHGLSGAESQAEWESCTVGERNLQNTLLALISSSESVLCGTVPGMGQG